MHLVRDFRTALRALARKPGVTALAVASLTLAIGFSTAAFSVLDAYSFRDLPVRQPKELQWIYVNTREHRPDGLSWREYEGLAARSRTFSEVVAQCRMGPAVKLPDRQDFPISAIVSDNYFDVLGVKAAKGAVFHTGKGQDGVVVLADRYWRQMLGGDPKIIGRSLEVGRGVLRVSGVLPPGFAGASRGIAVDLFLPSQAWFGSVAGGNPDARDGEYETLGRLRPGASMGAARAELDGILRQLERDGLAAGPDRKVALEDFTDKNLLAKVKSYAIFLAAMVLLILIAAANLANLRLVDNEGRRRETAVRLALGAGTRNLAAQHFAEAILLGVAGTALGLMLASWLIRVAGAMLYAGKSYLDYGIALDRRTFGFSAGALAVVALVGAAIPLLDAWKRQIAPALQGSRIVGSSRWLSALVVTQMALVTAATCSAGLLWRSLQNVSAIRPAMDPDRKMLMVTGFWRLPAGQTTQRAEVLGAGLTGLPGVEQVAWARRALLSGSGGGATVTAELTGQPKLRFRMNQVSPGYFAATGARIVSGRGFTAFDGPDATPVVMVNAAFVRRFAGEHAVGEWITVAGKSRQIVGVVEDGPTIHLRETIEPYFYFPLAQLPAGNITGFIQTRQNPAELAALVRRTARSVDPGFTLLGITTMAQHMRGARSSELLAANVTGGLAAVGLLLAAAGLFGVTLFAVARRTPEFGVRVAMGATPGKVARQVLREAGVRIAIALPMGWALAYAGRTAMEKMLYGVTADDPRTFFAASLVVAAVGCAAALHPALRAARVDPMAALRHE